MADPAANERLTATAAVPLVILLAVEGVTLLFLGPLLPVHIVVGLMLVPPVALKLGSTGWRMARYYRGDAAYVRRGPPSLPLRLTAPLLALSTASVLGTGIAMLAVRRGGVLLLLHQASFVAFAPAFGVHVLAYVWRVPRLARAAARIQRFAVVGAVGLGVVAAMLGTGDADIF